MSATGGNWTLVATLPTVLPAAKKASAEAEDFHFGAYSGGFSGLEPP
jgi:hypothetical protein